MQIILFEANLKLGLCIYFCIYRGSVSAFVTYTYPCMYYSLLGRFLNPPSTHSHHHLYGGQSRPGWLGNRWTPVAREFPQRAPTGKTTHSLITGSHLLVGNKVLFIIRLISISHCLHKCLTTYHAEKEKIFKQWQL